MRLSRIQSRTSRSSSTTATLRAIVVPVCPSGRLAGSEGDDRLALGTPDQELDALFGRIEDRVTPPGQRDALFERPECLFEREGAVLQLLDQPLQPLEDLVEALFRRHAHESRSLGS